MTKPQEHETEEAKILSTEKVVSMSPACAVMAYNHLQPLTQDGASRPPSARLTSVRKNEIMEVVSILDKLEEAIEAIHEEALTKNVQYQMFVDEVEKKKRQFDNFTAIDYMNNAGMHLYEAVEDTDVRFTKSEFQRIKEFYHDDKKPWNGGHAQLRIIAKLIELFT